MKNILRCALVSLSLLFCATVAANAATCFWVGGTGTWDNSTDAAHWSSSTGGAGSTCAATGGVPKNAGDVATFDGSSGGGTVTNNVDISIAQITMGAFTGTLDFATNNKNVTLTTAFSGTGTGTRTLNMGNGTWTLSGATTVWDITTNTNFTLNANSSTISLTGGTNSTRKFIAGAKNYNIVSFGAYAAKYTQIQSSGNFTIATMNITAPCTIQMPNNVTITLSNAPTWTGTSTNPIFIVPTSTDFATGFSITGTSSMSWVALTSITFTSASNVTATNSLDGGGNTISGGGTLTITPPSAGGGRIIGG